MKKLGKKVKMDKKSLQAYIYCICSTCSCPTSSNTYASKYIITDSATN